MIRYIIRRSLGAVLVVFVVSILTFAIFQLGPALTHNSPLYYYVGKQPPAKGSVQYNLMLHAYGFDKPIPVQYLVWLKHLFTGQNVTDGTSGFTRCSAPCLGYSYRLNTSVTALIGAAVPVSLSLAFGASILWLFGGLLVGTISGLRPGSIVDRIGMTLALGAVSIPIFFTGPILLLIFVYQLKWLPNVTYAGITQDPAQWLKSMILPWIALALTFAALYARLTRANMMEVMSEDYIRTARAKGLPRRTVVVRHGLRSALTPDRDDLRNRPRYVDRQHGDHRAGVQPARARPPHHPGPEPAGSTRDHGRDDHRSDRARRGQPHRRHRVRRGRSARQLQLANRRSAGDC